ncbi:sigma-E factor regulatory protein RseB domain-containing protein [Actinomadura rupiterrae]|uniref:sigma-E factor regulatory protein RseB domain-containing protein n=1 Tax=Actinomadura rupiterrae TaxID=559627 RepID=UPI0020A59568|nr:sigma-E factor regulatory protein RseB domain-containing protein [Actinomadura rupiterrae]MCP2336527.1 sigma-E factor negative regulatory protein RseB [Actinomadura rupiterrae]
MIGPVRPRPRRPRGDARCRGRRALTAVGIAGALCAGAVLAGDAHGDRPAPSDPDALRLLRAAADAAGAVSYQGERVLTTWGRHGTHTTTAQVEHAPGADVPLGVTRGTLALLVRNYSLVRREDGTMCGRRAAVVEARRSDGSTAGRFWLDADTGLMLHRELLDTEGRAVVVVGFNNFQIVRPATPERAPAPVPVRGSSVRADEPGDAEPYQPASGPMTRLPSEESLTSAQVKQLREDGWPMPRTLPGRLALYDVRRSDGPSGDQILHLSYSDGLAVVSVFVQHGGLDKSRMKGWTRERLDGRTAYRRDTVRNWVVEQRGGYVYTVLTDAPESTASAAAEAFPEGHPAFWPRMRRGFGRLTSWANPFD